MEAKKLTIFPILALLCTSCTVNARNIPTFEKSKGLTFSAYAGPTVAKWDGSSDNPNTLTPENMIKLSEAGFNKVIALYEGASNAKGEDTYDLIEKRSVKAQKDALIALNAIKEAGVDLKYFVRDWSYYGLVKNYTSGYSPNILTDEQYSIITDKMFDEENEYIRHPNFGGMFTHDEPTYEELERIAVQVRLYYEKMKELGIENTEAFVNLYNCTVSDTGLSNQQIVTYEQYVDRCLELISPYTGYICFDYYPFKSNFYDGSYIRNTYVYNLNMLAKKVKEQREKGNDIELRTFLQSVGNETGMRDMVSIGDFRLQIYTEMAFGSHEFIYYEYANARPQTGFGYALFDLKNNVYNWTYDLAKTVNNEVHAFEDAFLAYNWDGVMYKCADEMLENQALAMLEGDALESHPRVKIKDCTQDVLMGTFKNDKGDDAFMLVNYTDPYHQLDNEVKLHFNNAKALLMYRCGQKMIVNLPFSGDYTVKLYPGEGRFIIPIKQEVYL